MEGSPKYRDCLLIAKQINSKSIPELIEAYEAFARQTKDFVLSRSELNTSRSYTKAAIKTLRTDKIDNKNIKNYLELLSKKDRRLNDYSDNMDDLLRDLVRRFVKEKRIISETNASHINEIKRGVIPADEVAAMLVELGNKINKLTFETLESFRLEIESLIKKIEKGIVDEVFATYRSILKLDNKTFERIEQKTWSNSEISGLFPRVGAYENNKAYTSGLK